MTSTTDPAEALAKAIDAHWEASQGDGHRYHLGASIIGRACGRYAYLTFWWWHGTRHKGRLLRLFNRGQREEAHAVENLRRLGLQVQDTDEGGLRQVKFTSLWGLFGGERDGKLGGAEHYGLQGEGLLEFKTHGEKSFKQVQDKGVLSAKPEHYIQMQMYMHWSGLPWALYYAVNKNTDELYLQVIPYRPEVAEQYTDRARRILQGQVPDRISEDPSWWVCKFCDLKRQCHEGAPADVNCRTCEHVELRLGDEDDPNGHTWVCNLWGGEIPSDFTRKGCDRHSERPLP